MVKEFPSGLLQTLRSAQKVTVLTGAGVSKESGIPTFRDKLTGFWARFDPEELTSVGAFQRNPQLVWEWHEWLASQMADAQPNSGHFALSAMERKIPEFGLITQNIDGLHQRAGSTNVVELHGNIHRLICSAERRTISDRSGFSREIPSCPRCGAYLRHDVVWFGERLPPEAMEQAQIISQSCEVFLCVGTSAVVQPAASLPVLAVRSGAILVEINLAPTALTGLAHFSLRSASADSLTKLLHSVFG